MRRAIGRCVWGLCVLAPVAAGLFRVWVHHDAVQMGYRLSEEGRRRVALHRVEQELEIELAAERSPDRLARLAGRLGLTQPRPEQILGDPSDAAATAGRSP